MSHKYCSKCKLSYNNYDFHCCKCKIIYSLYKMHCCLCKKLYNAFAYSNNYKDNIDWV